MDNGTRRSKQRHQPTLGSLAEAYERYTDTLSLSPETIDTYRRALRLFLRYVPPETPVKDLSELDIQRWMRHRRDEEGISPNTLRSDLRRLRSGFFAWATEKRAIQFNWAKLAKMPPAERKELRSIEHDGFVRMLAATAESVTEHRDRALLWILWDTGARIGEVNKLCREDLFIDRSDMDADARNEVRFRAEVTKTGVERRVPVSALCVSALADYFAFTRGGDPGPLWLNSRTAQPLEEQALKHIVIDIGRKAGMKASAHDFRRGLVERLQSGDVPMPDSIIGELTGHESLEMIKRYGRRRAAENARAFYRKRLAE